MKWRYKEESTGKEFSKSEGLAVASFRMFMDGRFSTAGREPLQVNDEGLYRLENKDIAAGFQISEKNFRPASGPD